MENEQETPPSSVGWTRTPPTAPGLYRVRNRTGIETEWFLVGPEKWAPKELFTHDGAGFVQNNYEFWPVPKRKSMYAAPAPEPPKADVPDVYRDAAHAVLLCTQHPGTDGDRYEMIADELRARFSGPISALAMIARHPCWAASKRRNPDSLMPEYHCGACAACVAREEIEKLNETTK